MKNLLILFLCFTFRRITFAQKDSLAFDDHGKYIYYKLVSINNTKADTLYNRGLLFFKSASDKSMLKLISADAKNTALSGGGYFLVSKKNSLTKHDDGKIVYTLKIEAKDNKYRYWLTDFTFTPYYRDRYNNYVPQKDIEIPLEKAAKKLDAKDLDNFLDATATYGKHLGEKLKFYMEKHLAAKKDTAKKVIDIKKW